MCTLKGGVAAVMLPLRRNVLMKSLRSYGVQCRQNGWSSLLVTEKVCPRCTQLANNLVSDKQLSTCSTQVPPKFCAIKLNCICADTHNSKPCVDKPLHQYAFTKLLDGAKEHSSILGHVILHRNYSALGDCGRGPLSNTNGLLNPGYASPTMMGYPVVNARHLGWLATAVRSVLKIRYLLLGGAIGGTASFANQYEDWKKGLPNMDWIKNLIPSDSEINKLRSSLVKASENIKGKAEEIDMDPVLGTISSYRKWFEKRLNDAIVAADKPVRNATEATTSESSVKEVALPINENSDNNGNGSDWGNLAIPLTSALAVTSVGGSDRDNKRVEEERKRTEEERQKNVELQKQLEAAQEELMRTQIRYQKELEKLEKQNKELKQQLLLKTNSAIAKKQIKKSLIDMYSEVLDELTGYDTSYSHADHLPRVVVVGKKIRYVVN